MLFSVFPCLPFFPCDCGVVCHALSVSACMYKCECRVLQGLEEDVGPCGGLNKISFHGLVYLYILYIFMLSPQLVNFQRKIRRCVLSRCVTRDELKVSKVYTRPSLSLFHLPAACDHDIEL